MRPIPSPPSTRSAVFLLHRTMPRQPRKPGSGKAPVNTPARGAGWGGPAKGEGRGGGAGGGMPMYPRLAPIFTEADNALLDEAQATWIMVMRDPAEPALNRMAAAEKLRNHISGTPVQRVVTAEAPLKRLDDEQLNRAIELLESATGGRVGDIAGGEDETDIGKSSGIV